MNLVLIETSGNQRYIFATNKLRENVGASELTSRVGTEVVGATITGKSEVVPIITISGKALFLVEDKTIAESIVSDVTKRALIEMPGLIVHGAIVGGVNDDLSNIDEKIKEVHERHAQIRFQIPSNEQRFLRLPFVAPCDTSGLPASKVKQYEDETEAKRYSQMASVKSKYRDEGYQRIQNKFPSINFIEPEDIEKRNWVAVIHADGNGVGGIFLNFADRINYEDGKEKGQTYREKYRRFSDALDDCTIKATQTALERFQEKYLEDIKEKRNELEEIGKDEEAEELKKIPIVPLVLGGDDLTVLCDGQYALKFTHDFLTEFENQTNQSGIIREIAQNAFGIPRLGICAGVAIIKPHYPFHQAYELAEQLLQSAKQVKTKVVQSDGRQIPCSALDFHILYDSAHSDLNEIRDEKLKVAGERTYLFAKPYVVTEQSGLPGQDDNAWLSYRRFEELKKRVRVMGRKEEDDPTKKLLPNSKLHEIRQSLFRGKEVTDAEVALVKNRLSSGKKKTEDKSAKEIFEDEILVEEKTLFFNESGRTFTHFLDAIEAVDFWKGFNENADSSSTDGEVNDEQ